MPEFGPHVAEASIHWSSLFPVEQLLQLQGFSSYLIDIYIQIQMRSNLGLIHLGPLQRQCKVVDSEIRSYIVWTHLPFWFLNFIFSARFFINSQCIVNWGASGKTPNSKLRVRLGTSKDLGILTAKKVNWQVYVYLNLCKHLTESKFSQIIVKTSSEYFFLTRRVCK